MSEVPKTVPIERKETPFEVIDEEAGSGGMGTIHRARDRATGRMLAVKVLKSGDGDVTRFALEADILAKLRHPNIIEHAYHGVTKDGFPYLAMEWVDGETLEEKLRLHGKLPLEESLRIGYALAAALTAAHDAGVVHRDIKPSNVLLDKDGVVKLVDFGIAKSRDTTVDLTATGEALGTPGYLAPEQARGGKVDGRSDLFSVGCLLFRCLTGRRPFSGADLMEYASNLALVDAPRVRELEPSVPAPVEALLARLLMKDPNARPANAKHVRDAINRILSSADATAPAPTVDAKDDSAAAQALLEPVPPTKLAEGSQPKLIVGGEVRGEGRAEGRGEGRVEEGGEETGTLHSPAVAKKKRAPLPPEEAVKLKEAESISEERSTSADVRTVPLPLAILAAMAALAVVVYAAYSYLHRDKPVAALPAPTSPTPFVVGETWFGSYECDDGQHKLALRIQSIDLTTNEVHAVFDFKTPQGTSGSYNVLGAYAPSTHHLTLKAGTWITQPNLVVSVGLDGTITDDDRAYSGKAVNPKCTTFTLRR